MNNIKSTNNSNSNFQNRNTSNKRKNNSNTLESLPTSTTTTNSSVLKEESINNIYQKKHSNTTSTTHKQKRKRRRTKHSLLNSDNCLSISTKTNNNNILKPLNGLILAISTFDHKEQNSSTNTDSSITLPSSTNIKQVDDTIENQQQEEIHNHDTNDTNPTASLSYNSVSNECKALGATISPQIHKKVYALICNQSAILQATQRVRKAVKKCIDIVNVEWVYQCKATNSKLSVEQFLLNDLAKTVVNHFMNEKKEKELLLVQKKSLLSSPVSVKNSKVQDEDSNNDDDDDDTEFLNDTNIDDTGDTDAGWSKPVSLGCCCVCHDDNRTDCKWCVDCDVTLSKLK